MLGTYEIELNDINTNVNFIVSINEARQLTRKVEELNRKIEEIKSGVKWNEYISQAKVHLLAYTEVTTDKFKGIIIIGKKRVDKEKTDRRLEIISNYLEIAGKYIELDISRNETLPAMCPICDALIKDFDIDDDSNICSCPNCGWYRENLSKSLYNRDSGKTNSSNKNDYEDRENFSKTIIRHACKQLKTFHKDLFKDLDEYFIKLEIGPSEYISKLPLVKGRRQLPSVNGKRKNNRF